MIFNTDNFHPKIFLISWVFLLWGCSGNGNYQQLPDSRITVLQFCKMFATKYAENLGKTYQKYSSRINQLSALFGWLSNIFQPRGSRFIAGYDCHFQMNGYGLSVNVFLAESKHFAEHTQWPGLQIIPIEYVVDECVFHSTSIIQTT